MADIRGRSACRVTVKISLPAALVEDLDALAEQEGMSRSGFIRAAIERMFEDADDVAASEAALGDENDPLVPWEQVRREVGL